MQNSKDRSKSRVSPALAFAILGMCIPLSHASADSGLALEKTHVLYVKGFNATEPMDPVFRGATTWTQTQKGYVLRTLRKLYFYSHELELTHSIGTNKNDPIGASSLVKVDDTLLYVLEHQWISSYDLKGKLMKRWYYPSPRTMGLSLAVIDNKIMIAGFGAWFGTTARYPRFILYDTTGETKPMMYTDFFPDQVLDSLQEKLSDVGNSQIGASTASFQDGFAVAVDGRPEIFLFSPTGEPHSMIKGYSTESNSLDSVANLLSSFPGIAVYSDSLLVVPRYRNSSPFFLDIYNLSNFSFLDRLEIPHPLVGVSSGQLFFADSFTNTSAKISAYRLVPGPDTIELSGSAEIATLIKPNISCNSSDTSSYSGKTGCCAPTNSFEHVQCSPEKLNVVDTVPAGPDRIAQVICNYVLTPDSLNQFCSRDKKNLILFVAPDGRSGVLMDSLSNCLVGKTDDWLLTTVICYPIPDELSLYMQNIPGEQILINRCGSIPDSTLQLSDLAQPPMVLAFSEGGKELISGYSLAPNFDRQKKEKNIGITFDVFLTECGLIESEWE